MSICLEEVSTHVKKARNALLTKKDLSKNKRAQDFTLHQPKCFT